MLTCTRRLEFDYGHRLLRHESKCAHVHGHRGRVDITCSAEGLDRVGRVIDFSVVKRVVGDWIDRHWDHAFVVNIEDHAMVQFLFENGQRSFTFPGEPSAENLAAFIGQRATYLLKQYGIWIPHVRFYETPNGWADWEPGDTATMSWADWEPPKERP